MYGVTAQSRAPGTVYGAHHQLSENIVLLSLKNYHSRSNFIEILVTTRYCSTKRIQDIRVDHVGHGNRLPA